MNPVLDALIEMNIAAAAAIIFLLAVRKPARRIFGPHAIYLLWAIVPIAAAATFIPSRTIEMLSLGLTLDEVIALTTPPAANSLLEAILPYALIAIWIIGAIATAIALIRRQAAFMRDADLGLAGPAIVGFSQPRIVTPDDFSRRFSDAERKLILTHEQVHLDRNDARINAVVALIRCAFWFNPLVHIGAKAMRVDQELSCDAEVIDRRPRVRRAYAETLLKTQLASRPLPVGCYWPAEAQHPLAERIDMLARKPLSGRRRIAATAVVLALTASAGVAAWAAQPKRTVITEAPDLLVPFKPIQPDQQALNALTTNPRPQANFNPFIAPPADLNVDGDVVVELCVSASGAVADAKVAQSSGHPKLDQATLRQMRGARFEPATRNGRPVEICGYNMTVGWRLGGAPP
ncbi:MAG: TonB family protein [Hyphomonadaceae bacterium]|nr:TonB family protein [Hyphomonadaceae bacterium]